MDRAALEAILNDKSPVLSALDLEFEKQYTLGKKSITVLEWRAWRHITLKRRRIHPPSVDIEEEEEEEEEQ
jgi:hypothetical protein